ncbi:MAG: outer membrane beta-barrel protein [Flavobacterium sp.]
MKHFFLLNLLLISFLTYSQERPGLYLLTGLVNSNLNSSAVEAKNSDIGYIAGVGWILGYSERLSWQVEIGYYDAPVSLKANDDQFYKYNFGNVQSGAYLTYNVIMPDENKFYFGPQLGLNFNFGKFSSQDSNYSGSKLFLPSGVDEMSLHDNVSVLHTNLVLGLNATYNRFKLNLRYAIGFNNVFKEVTTRNNNNEFGSPSGNTIDRGTLNTISLIVSYKLSRF